MGTNLLQALQEWYSAQCDGVWEHSYGVHIETLDNPGWLIKIDLNGTPLATQAFETIDQEQLAEWYHCRRSDTQFIAACGPRMLEVVLSIFLNWADNSKSS